MGSSTIGHTKFIYNLLEMVRSNLTTQKLQRPAAKTRRNSSVNRPVENNKAIKSTIIHHSTINTEAGAFDAEQLICANTTHFNGLNCEICYDVSELCFVVGSLLHRFAAVPFAQFIF